MRACVWRFVMPSPSFFFFPWPHARTIFFSAETDFPFPLAIALFLSCCCCFVRFKEPAVLCETKRRGIPSTASRMTTAATEPAGLAAPAASGSSSGARHSAAAPLLHTPIQLCTYAQPRPSQHTATYELCNASARTTRHSHVAVGDVVRLSSRGALGSVRRRRGLVALLEQGTAIVLMDLQTQTPVHTHTLAPSDHVCTPPLVVERSLYVPAKQPVRTTYVGVQATSEHTEVRAYTEMLDSRGKHVPAHAPGSADSNGSRNGASSGVGMDMGHQTVGTVPGTLCALYALGNGQLLATRKDGAVLLLADPIAAQSVRVLATYDSGNVLLHHVCLLDSNDARTLLPHEHDAARPLLGALALAASASPTSTDVLVHIVGVHTDSLYAQTCMLPAEQDIMSCALEPHGRLHVLTSGQKLLSARFHAVDARLVIDEPSVLQLPPVDDASLVCLSASHLLAVVLRTEHGRTRASALLWDMDLDAVVATVEWSLALSGPARISATRAMDDYVLVQVDPYASSESKCSVVALPVSVPTTGLLRHALGAAARTAPWLVSPETSSVRSPDLCSAHASGSPRARALLDRLQGLPTHDAAARAKALDAHVLAWLEAESDALREATQTKAGRKAPKVPLDAALVQQVMDMALPALPGTSASALASSGTSMQTGRVSSRSAVALPYAREAVRYFVERGAVSTSLLPDLVPRARLTHDWSLVFLLLRHVPDMSEAQALTFLHDALRAAADSDPQAPAIPRVLQHILLPPAFSKPALRVALRTHITDDADVLILLDILNTWIDLHMASAWDSSSVHRMKDEVRTLPLSSATAASKPSLSYRTGGVQPARFDACLSFMEDLIDTFFPQWLGATAMHPFLRECTRSLSTHAHTLQMVSRLRAPLEGLISSAQQAESGDDAQRSRRLALHEASLLVPAYSKEVLDV